MFKIAIVEDQEETRESLNRFVRQYAQEQGLQVEISLITDGAEIAEHYTPGFDIIFMDVEMPRLDGFGAAEAIRAVDADVVLVFVTNMAQYAIRGYEVDALDYVLKPVNYYQFCTKLSRAIQRVQRRRGGQVVLQLAGGGIQLLDTADIYYLETHSRMLYYHTSKGEFAARASLQSAEKQLAEYHFVRCNQCYLVNLAYVKGIENDFALVKTTGWRSADGSARPFLLRWHPTWEVCCDHIPAEQSAPGAAALGRGAWFLPAFAASAPFLGPCLRDAAPAAFVGAAAGPADTVHNTVAAAAPAAGTLRFLFALLGGMIYLCTDINKKGALYCAVWSLLIAQCAYESWCFLELQFTRYGHPLNMASPWAVLVQLLSGAVFFAAVYILLARQLPYKGEYHIGPRQLFSAFFIGILFMVQAAVLDNARADHTPLSLTVTILIGQFYFITLLYFQSELFKKSAMEKEMNELNLLYERQRQQYQVARQNVQIINKRCHELKVQIANLRKLSPEAVPQERIDEAERAARLYDANRNTGNEVLDVVLTEKSLLCESRGIQLNAVANGSCLGFFEAGDLYALFANALDHAVESAVQASRPECRVIDLLVCVRQSFVVVNIISPLRPPEQQANRSAQYELKVIRRIVQKYKGTLTLKEQGEFFAEKIIFPLQK